MEMADGRRAECVPDIGELFVVVGRVIGCVEVSSSCIGSGVLSPRSFAFRAACSSSRRSSSIARSRWRMDMARS